MPAPTASPAPPAAAPARCRRRRRPRLVPRAALAALGTLAALTAGACQRPGAGAPGAGPELAIGVAFDPRRPGMEPLVHGIELAVAELNATPEARARGLRFVVRRAPAALITSTDVAARLRDDPAVVGIVGDAESGRTLEALPVLEDRDGDGSRAVVAISPTATSTVLVGRSPWLFRLSPPDDAASRAVARDALGRGARRAAVVYRNDAFGRDWAAAFTAAFRAQGGDVVARDPYLPRVMDWDVYARALAAQRPDVVIFPAFAEDAGPFLRALIAAGLDVPVVGGDALAPLADSSAYLGLRFATPFDPRKPRTAGGAAFVRTFRARHGALPGVRAALGYEAARLIGEAALAVDLDDAARRRLIRDRLATLGDGGVPAGRGVAGAVAFDANHAVRGRAVSVATVGEPEAPEIALDAGAPAPAPAAGGTR